MSEQNLHIYTLISHSNTHNENPVYMLFVLNVVGLEMIQKPLMIERNVHKNLIQIVRNFYVTI